ncbi:MAG: FtsW/RodA/SpoVE family cell cycle protein, partial [Patescibacteria group bacterium]|nr:FtsW/RodA/SpoVE family cell cycle protein [Patescibacteria group bacterium]
VSVALLAIVLLLGISSHGAVRWLNVLGFSIQFTELLKPFLAISLVSLLAKRESTSFATFGKVLLFLLPVAFLIYRQPDLGNALIYMLATFVVLLFYGFPFKWFAVGLAAVGAAIPLIWQFLHQYQRDRLLTFFHISNDPLGLSYNAIQSVIAVGSGTFLGKGLGLGTQSALRFLPERHTDFIFATLSEQLGFVGSAIVVVAFCFLLFRLYVLYTRQTGLFERLFIVAAFALLLIQFFANVGMNIGIIPIVGVTLPFVSFGGNSFLSNAIFLGIIVAMERQERQKNVLEIT